MSSRVRLAVLTVSTPVLAFAVIGGFLGNAVAREDTYRHLRVFQDVVSLITGNYVEEPDLSKVMQGALRGLAEALDSDSSFLRADEVRLVEQGTSDPDGDSGLVVTRQYYLRVVGVRDGSAAARAGIAPGDVIRGIDGKATRDLSAFAGARLLRGPVGSKVTLTILRGSIVEPHEVTIVREKVANPPVTGRIAAPGVGYLRIPSFQTAVPGQISARVGDLTKAGATRLIIDVRRTAEGPFTAGVAAARLFVASGKIGSREARGETLENFTTQPGDGAIKIPVTLLTNEGTSGAAEIFVAALTGNDRAEVIGVKTSGRAAMNKLVKLPDGTGLWLSWTRFVGPTGTPIHGKGVEPTLPVDEPDVEFGSTVTSDPILDKALERAPAARAA
jgi:carboxyl-terminal processing protease